MVPYNFGYANICTKAGFLKQPPQASKIHFGYTVSHDDHFKVRSFTNAKLASR
ncbi:hypothetical protein SAMN05444004_12919 [Jannaschia faecimaris]|uniref:Uncharacterized protein n=1 Tax=Jannaschia faecimaris TaxID=1244108 RepID=A0A1H3UCP5_9RHOB|nr:hypothetical protein SAMN05444004_12919 [Jannaschia faecimaris]